MRKPTCLCGKCKRCKHREYMRGWYQRKTAEERRAWTARRDREKINAGFRKRRQEQPEKVHARDAVHNALRRGKLERQPCEVCGTTVRVHAHHDDYSKPLDVRWLCFEHHVVEHGAAFTMSGR